MLSCLFLLYTISCGVFAEEETAQVKSKILKIGYAERPPHRYTSEEGEPVGSDIEYLSGVLDSANINYQFFSYPWKRVIRLVETGQLDIAMAAAKIEERQAFAYFSGEIFSVGDNVLLVHENYSKSFSQFTSLAQLIVMPVKIAVTRGSSYSDEYDLLLSNPAFTERLMPVNSINQAVTLALSGRITGFITSFALAQYELIGRCEHEQFSVAYRLLEDENTASYLMYSKKTVSLAIVAQIDNAMKIVKRLPAGTKPIDADTGCILR